MIELSEWLPNPAGPDATGEWVEIVNTGPVALSLRGYALLANTKKQVALPSRIIAPDERVIISRAETRLSLVNSDGRLALIDPTGRVVSAVRFVGAAPEGQSANVGQDGFIFFASPTPGQANSVFSQTAMMMRSFPFGEPLRAAFDPLAAGSIGFAVAVALAAVSVILLKQQDDLRELFFGSD